MYAVDVSHQRDLIIALNFVAWKTTKVSKL